jgi:hypothetical protein
VTALQCWGLCLAFLLVRCFCRDGCDASCTKDSRKNPSAMLFCPTTASMVVDQSRTTTQARALHGTMPFSLVCVCTCRNTTHHTTTRARGVRVSVFRCDLTNVSATCNVRIRGNDDAERAERANGIVLTLLDAPSPSTSHARPTRASGDDEKARVSRREIASIGNVFSAAQRVGFTRSEPA